MLHGPHHRSAVFRPSVRKRVLQKRWKQCSSDGSEGEGGGLDDMVGLLRQEADLADGEVASDEFAEQVGL
jgi:hypothetical protein